MQCFMAIGLRMWHGDHHMYLLECAFYLQVEENNVKWCKIRGSHSQMATKIDINLEIGGPVCVQSFVAIFLPMWHGHSHVYILECVFYSQMKETSIKWCTICRSNH